MMAGGRHVDDYEDLRGPGESGANRREPDGHALGRALRYVACFIGVVGVVCVLTASGAEPWRKADLLLARAANVDVKHRTVHAGAGPKSDAVLHAQRLQRAPRSDMTMLLKQKTTMLQAANESADSNSSSNSNSNSSTESTSSAASGCSGKMATTFECWLASKTDPEDVEDWYKSKRTSHKFSHAQWYAEHKNYTPDTAKWYATVRNYTPSVAKWYEEHKNVSKYGGVDTDKWYAEHKNYQPDTAKWYAGVRNYTPSVAAWYEKHKNVSLFGGVDTDKWYAENKNYHNFSWADWLDKYNVRAEMKDKDAPMHVQRLAEMKERHTRLEALAEISSRLDGYSDEESRCGLECWMAQFRHHDQLAAAHGWFKKNRGHTGASLQKLEMQILMDTVEAWYQQHKSYGGPEMNTETWYANHKNYTPDVAKWYQAHKNYGGPEMNTEVWYANHKNYTPDVAKWYEEHKNYGGPEMNTEVWYANHKNYTPDVAKWYEEHKNYGGPEMNTEVWYANHKNYTPDVAKWYEEHKNYGGPEMNTEVWYANHKNYTPDVAKWYEEHKNYGGPEMNTEVWYANHKNYTGLFERADMVRAVLLWEVVRDIEEHSLLKKLREGEVPPALKAPVHQAAKHVVKQGAKQSRLAERFHLDGWLAQEPHADFLSLAYADAVSGTVDGMMMEDVSRYLDSKTSKDLDTWLVQEEGESSAQDKQDKQAKSDNILGRWLDRHASVNLGRWMQSFSRETTPLRARANARLAQESLSRDEAALHKHASTIRLSSQKVKMFQLAANKSGDPNSPQFDFETWWAELGQNESSVYWQSHVGGSNMTKFLPEPGAAQITASDSVGSGACCCGFACEEISNDCCGAWYPAGGGESYMHYGVMKQHPKSVAALSARAAAAHQHQRSYAALAQDGKARLTSLALVESDKPLNAKAAALALGASVRTGAAPKASVSKVALVEVPTTMVAKAFGDRGFLGWMCQAEGCTSAPVRVGATCDVECLSSDGISCMQSRSCKEQAGAAQDAKFVRCGAKMAEAQGTSGYDDPDHWCSCAKKQLAAQMESCIGRGGAGEGSSSSNSGPVYASGVTFGPNMDFAAGTTFGDSAVFGADDTFGDLTKFGNENKFGKGARFGMDVTFGDKNEFEEGTVFGRGVKLGDNNKIGKGSKFKELAVLGTDNQVDEDVEFGKKAKLGKGTVLAPGTKLAAGANIGDNSKVGDGSVIGVGAVIGRDVTIGKAVTLQSVKRMGGGTVIGAGSSIGESGPALAMLDGNETQGNSTEASGAEGEAGAEEDEEYYRPDPGSPYSRKGNAEINMELDGHNHWPVFLGDEDDNSTATNSTEAPTAQVAPPAAAKATAGTGMLAVLERKAATLTREAQDAVKALNQVERKMAPKQKQARKLVHAAA